MQKILLKGPNIYMENKNSNIKVITTLSELPSGTSTEYFISAHGSENFSLWGKIKSYFMTTPSRLSLSLFTENESEKSVLDFELLNKIQNNTPKDQCNIIHIYSCHSGAAQHHLKYIQGNIVLYTYNKAGDVNIALLAQNNYDARTNNDSSLIEYIRDNFHLLAASDFSISYKLNNQIYNFSLSSDKIKNMKSIKELPNFLSKKYQAFVKFYENIHLKYHGSYPEIFNSNVEANPKELEHADLIRVFNRVLTIEAYNFNKSSLSKIKTILNQEGLNTEFALSEALEKGNFELLVDLLNYKNTSVSSSNLNKAITKGNLDVLKTLLQHPTTEIDPSNLNEAITKGNLDVLKALLKHHTAKIELFNLNNAITKGDVDILKVVLDHPTTKVELFNLNEAITKGNLDILKAVLDHPTTKIDASTLNTAITEGDLDILKAVLEHPTTKIDSFNLNEAIRKGDLNILKTVLAHPTAKIDSFNLNEAIRKGDLNILKTVLAHPTTEIDSYITAQAESTNNLEIIELIKNYNSNTIKPEETIVETTILEEVQALGEASEE